MKDITVHHISAVIILLLSIFLAYVFSECLQLRELLVEYEKWIEYLENKYNKTHNFLLDNSRYIQLGKYFPLFCVRCDNGGIGCMPIDLLARGKQKFTMPCNGTFIPCVYNSVNATLVCKDVGI